MGLIQNVSFRHYLMSIFSANDLERSNHKQHVEQQDDYAVTKSSSHSWTISISILSTEVMGSV